jgi:hypothetical protein
VQVNDAILLVRYRDGARLQSALPLLERAVHIGPERRPAKKLILDEVS